MRKITVKGKEYILRYDMVVNEWVEEKYGNLRDFLNAGSTKEANKRAEEIFLIMANAANDYLAEMGQAERKPEIRAEDVQLISRHSNPGWTKAVWGYITSAIADGNRMQSSEDDGDTEVKDGYLKELNEIEKIKN